MDRKLRFIGEDRHKVDGKGRVSIPAPFRRVLEAEDPDWAAGKNPQLVLVYGDEKREYLECFTIRAIEKIYDKIEKFPRRDPRRLALQRLYQTNAQIISVDETGRLVLSQKLRDKVGLTDVAYFAGIGESFEIWDPERFSGGAAGPQDSTEYFDPDADPAEYLDGDM